VGTAPPGVGVGVAGAFVGVDVAAGEGDGLGNAVGFVDGAGVGNVDAEAPWIGAPAPTTIVAVLLSPELPVTARLHVPAAVPATVNAVAVAAAAVAVVGVTVAMLVAGWPLASAQSEIEALYDVALVVVACTAAVEPAVTLAVAGVRTGRQAV
jgi:hypothetical protein